MVLGLVEPESSGIGGGAFMLLFDPKTKKTTSFDGREMAPASARADMFLDANGKARTKPDAIPGGLSVGIPGVVKMLEMAHKKYGKLPWAKLFEPAIKLAEDGFPVGPKLARTIRLFARGAEMPDIKAHFYHADGTPLNAGEIYKNADYAASLKAIAAGGSNGLLHRRDRAGDRGQGAARAQEPGRHDLGRPRQLQGAGARSRVRRLSRLAPVLDGAAVIGRHRHCADPGHAAAVSVLAASTPTR